MFDVVGIDTPCIDLNVNTERFPSPGHGGRIERLSWQGGGKVASGMAACARLGAKCAMMGCVGDDIYGNFILKDFVRHGVDISAMKVQKSAVSPLCIVLSDYETSNRAFLYHPGADLRFGLADMNLEMIRHTKYLFISSVNGDIEQAADIAREAGARIFIDADGYSDEIMAMLPKIDVFVGSEMFYNRLFDNADHEENCRYISAMGPGITVFTFGDKGCAGVSGEGFFRLPAFPVKVEDTVGAGDVFHGAFLAGLLNGDTAKEAARFASGAAAVKCTRIGGRAGVPDRETLQRFLLDGTIDYTEIDARVEFYQRGLERYL